MPASLRELRQRRNSVATTMKITKAMELIAASRVTKAQLKARKSDDYTRELVKAVSSAAAYSRVDHPLTNDITDATRVDARPATTSPSAASSWPAPGPVSATTRTTGTPMRSGTD